MGVFLIVGDLFFEEKTKKLLSYWEVENASGHPFAMFVTYLMVPVYTFGAVTFVTSYSGIATSGPFSEFLGGVSREQINELVFFTLLGVVIFSGPYYYVLEKRNDRILGTGVGLSVTGLTFATSAQITTAFF